MNQHQLHAQDQILVHLYSPCFPSYIGATKIKCELTQKWVFLLQEQCCSEKLKIERLCPLLRG